ncbi:hypothetical protein ACQY0O_007492 [Thecaphora frezii]
MKLFPLAALLSAVLAASTTLASPLASPDAPLEQRAKKPLVYTLSKVRCFTDLGPKRVNHVRTLTHTRYRHYTAKATKTLHPRTTVTPAALTQTITLNPTATVTVTDPAVTDTFSTTSTLTETITLSPTLTTTETATATDTTTVSSTITVAPPFFTPISVTNPNASLERRGAVQDESASLQLRHYAGNRSFCDANFPQVVRCTKKVNLVTVTTYTKTGKPCTATAAAATRTATVTSTVTSTSTLVPPGVTETRSFTATATATSTLLAVTQTETATTTTTQTVALPVATSYPGCNEANQVKKFNGQWITGGSPDYSRLGQTSTTAKNSYDCCSVCFNNPKCFWSAFKGSTCIMFTGKTESCDATMTQGFTTTHRCILSNLPSAANTAYTYSNGACAQVVFS